MSIPRSASDSEVRVQTVSVRHGGSTGLGYDIRPMAPSDETLEAEFLARLSPRSSYQRLMSARRPTSEEIRRWTRVDGVREVALVAVAVVAGLPRQLGVTRYVKDAAGITAEFALVVEDAYQRRGIGRALLSALIARARTDAHLAALNGTTMSENMGMVKLAKELGFQSAHEPGSWAVTSLTLPLHTYPCAGGKPDVHCPDATGIEDSVAKATAETRRPQCAEGAVTGAPTPR